ncbi:hypothetical protein GCM10023220_22030 [Streptomyces ziwulingensis]|uniref:Uncharacterized protein n=1 Tax=Streptomyces ziwulingensis TaxID=1045501 RepID=A0ABP9BGP2_9ACTN
MRIFRHRGAAGAAYGGFGIAYGGLGVAYGGFGIAYGGLGVAYGGLGVAYHGRRRRGVALRRTVDILLSSSEPAPGGRTRTRDRPARPSASSARPCPSGAGGPCAAAAGVSCVEGFGALSVGAAPTD